MPTHPSAVRLSLQRAIGTMFLALLSPLGGHGQNPAPPQAGALPNTNAIHNPSGNPGFGYPGLGNPGWGGPGLGNPSHGGGGYNPGSNWIRPGNYPYPGRPGHPNRPGDPGHHDRPGNGAGIAPVIAPYLGAYPSVTDPAWLDPSGGQSRASFTYFDWGGPATGFHSESIPVPSSSDATPDTEERSPSDISMSLPEFRAPAARRGVEAFRDGDYAVASIAVAQALEKAPRNGALRLLASLCAFAQGDFETSASELGRGLERLPPAEWEEVQRRLIGLYEGRLARYVSQLRALETHLELHPEAIEPRGLLGFHWLCGGNQEEGAALIQRVAASGPKSALGRLLPLALASGDSTPTDATRPATRQTPDDSGEGTESLELLPLPPQS